MLGDSGETDYKRYYYFLMAVSPALSVGVTAAS